MKKILTAMGNENLNKELMKYSKYDLYMNDLFYQEAVIDILKEEKYDVMITSSLLQGQLEFFDFVSKVRKIDGVMRIIVISDEADEFFKRKMSEFEVTDVFLDNNATVEEIIDAIDREEPLIKKYEMKKKLEEIKVAEEINSTVVLENIINKKIIQKQEIIVISGTNGAGKSTIATNFAKTLSRKTSSNILIIDLDTMCGNLDELLDINKVPQNVELLIDSDKKCGLNYACELIAKNRFDINVLEEIVIKSNGFDVLTGNTSLHYCQNVLNENCYKILLEAAKEKYDFIIIDTSSNIFLDSTKWALQQATKIFFVTENNYISMKKAGQLLEIFTISWKIWKEKISIIINKERVSGVEFEVVQKIFSDYKTIGKIKSEEENDNESYVKILENIKYVPKKSFINKLLINRFQNPQFNNNLQECNSKRGEVIRNAN